MLGAARDQGHRHVSRGRLVLKTSSGERVVLGAGEIEERAVSELSLMPDGLTETMSEQDLVDLLAFLRSL